MCGILVLFFVKQPANHAPPVSAREATSRQYVGPPRPIVGRASSFLISPIFPYFSLFVVFLPSIFNLFHSISFSYFYPLASLNSDFSFLAARLLPRCFSFSFFPSPNTNQRQPNCRKPRNQQQHHCAPGRQNLISDCSVHGMCRRDWRTVCSGPLARSVGRSCLAAMAMGCRREQMSAIERKNQNAIFRAIQVFLF